MNLRIILALLLVVSASVSADGKKGDHQTWMNNHTAPVTIKAHYVQKHADGEKSLVEECHHLRPGEAKKVAHRNHNEHAHTSFHFHHPKHNHVEHIRSFHKTDHKRLGAGAVINLADHAPKKGGKNRQAGFVGGKAGVLPAGFVGNGRSTNPNAQRAAPVAAAPVAVAPATPAAPTTPAVATPAAK